MSNKLKKTKPRKTHEQFVDEVKALVGDEYTVIGTYEKATTKIEMRHNNCPDSTVWSITPDNFLRGNRCRTCADKKKKRKVYKKRNIDKELLDYALVLLNMSRDDLEHQYSNNKK